MERVTASGAGLRADRSEFMVLGLNLADALRLVRSGSYDVVSTQVGLASRDDPFLEGIDLIGVSTNMDDLQAAVDAYREIFDKRISERFGAKVLAIWPFGPQVFFCNQPIKTLDDLKTLRVRSFTPSMSKLIEALGATPVSIPFPEVYPSLQRGVANCGVTSPTSANTGTLAGSHVASAAAVGVRLDPGASGQRRVVGEARPAAAGGDDARAAPDGEGPLGAGAHRQRGRDQLQHRQGALRAEAARQIHHDACRRSRPPISSACARSRRSWC